MKKWLGMFVIVLVLINLVAISLVSAQYYGGGYGGNINLRQGSEQVVQWIKDFAGPLFEALFQSPDYIFERFLFLILIMSFIYVALDKSDVFKDNNIIVWTITIIVSLLSTRYLTEVAFVQAILLPYSALGVAITAGIPLIIFFFFVMSFANTFVRRVLWALFIAVFIGLWITRYHLVGPLAWIYVLAAVLAFIFLIADGYLRRVMIERQYKQLGYTDRDHFSREIRREMHKLRKDLDDNVVNRSEFNRAMRKLKRKLKTLRKF